MSNIFSLTTKTKLRKVHFGKLGVTFFEKAVYDNIPQVQRILSDVVSSFDVKSFYAKLLYFIAKENSREKAIRCIIFCTNGNYRN